MARRMFNDQIVDSDAFLDMPLTTQALYFHLGMKADDDGFVNSPKRIMRTIGANHNDLDLLIMKNFIIGFENGVVVIKHWLIHNTIRKDRYKPTVYTKEYEQLEIKENKSYTLKCTLGNQMATERQPLVGVSKVKLNQVKLSKDNNAQELVDTEHLFEQFWNTYPKKIGKQRCLRWFKSRNIDIDFVEMLIEAVEKQKQSTQWQKEDGKFIPHPQTWLNRGGWEDELEYEKPVIEQYEEFLKGEE